MGTLEEQNVLPLKWMDKTSHQAPWIGTDTRLLRRQLGWHLWLKSGGPLSAGTRAAARLASAASPVIRPLASHHAGEPRMVANSPSSASPAMRSPSTAVAPADAGPFVFHDASGRRWSRIKRFMFMVAALLFVAGGVVLLAVTQVAPGRAPSFSTSIPHQVPDWPFRDPGNSATDGPSTAARPAVAVGPAQRQPPPSATIALPPTPSTGLSATPIPTPNPRPTPKPKRTKPPFASPV